jgi:hypothetical protein
VIINAKGSPNHIIAIIGIKLKTKIHALFQTDTLSLIPHPNYALKYQIIQDYM